MYSFAQTIKFKIIIAFGACITLIAVIGLFGTFGLSRLNSNMSGAYSGNTVPIADLSEVRADQLNVRLMLRRIQVFRDPAKTAEFASSIQTALERLDKSWNHYYPDGISSDKEREIAERIRSALPQFKAITNEVVAAASAGNFDAASAAIDKVTPVAASLNDALDQDTTFNLDQAKQFADDSESTFKAIFRIAIALVGVGILVAVAASVYLIRAISPPPQQGRRHCKPYRRRKTGKSDYRGLTR